MKCPYCQSELTTSLGSYKNDDNITVEVHRCCKCLSNIVVEKKKEEIVM